MLTACNALDYRRKGGEGIIVVGYFYAVEGYVCRMADAFEYEADVGPFLDGHLFRIYSPSSVGEEIGVLLPGRRHGESIAF